jgi:hypothetical protein
MTVYDATSGLTTGGVMTRLRPFDPLTFVPSPDAIRRHLDETQCLARRGASASSFACPSASTPHEPSSRTTSPKSCKSVRAATTLRHPAGAAWAALGSP